MKLCLKIQNHYCNIYVFLVPIEDKHQITVVIGIQWRIQELGEGGE